MKNLLSFLTTCLLSVCFAYSQDTSNNQALKVRIDTARSNPIIYSNLGFGAGLAGMKGLALGVDLNIQIKRHLFTVRHSDITDFGSRARYFALPVIGLFLLEEKERLQETSLLYGRRYIKGGRAFSFSAGLSYNKRVAKYTDDNNQRINVQTNYPGLPFEATINWFKSTKSRYRIYGIIPVGKPTGFGHSIGFRLSGNISKQSYAALGLILGIGLHKQY